ncbi:MAG TPA: hypothetical protein GXX50_00230 [Firmicutes bacterium]|jgi:hypothetical protein|uniref:hypothetical protein n=1 Tax=Gelria sp. Kuro-4 TaxID=2796927 RepID=UPI0019B68A8D|nr:hypothetical protein [Gelria sp. Kuro-4]MDI3521907.1 hypothetical protein [Bacillota bacterium]MDK2926577.1 hypothetical protein [Bacillota bacterium]BCV24958.1 hypothetical protein kuro4_17310 [Gelria sp. Kuro-4]HHV56178.1 hypothetical protein [Bacillota bacterium]
MNQVLPDILARPLGEARGRLAAAGFARVEIKTARAPGQGAPPPGCEVRVARVKLIGETVELVVVETRSEPVRQGAP